MSTFLQDLRYGVRTLAGGGVVTLGAIVTLALGIGANTAIFSTSTPSCSSRSRSNGQASWRSLANARARAASPWRGSTMR